MKFLSLEYIKQHIRVDNDDDDGLLEMYADSAEWIICKDLNRGKKIDDMIASLKDEYGEIPTPIYEAGCLLVAVSYEHPTPVSTYNFSPVGYTYEKKIKPFMKLTTNG